MSTSQISQEAASARENARDARGRFGSHPAAESGATLTDERFGSWAQEPEEEYDGDEALDYVDGCIDTLVGEDSEHFDVDAIRDEIFTEDAQTGAYALNGDYEDADDMRDLIEENRISFPEVVHEPSPAETAGEFDPDDAIPMAMGSSEPDDGDEYRIQRISESSGVTGSSTHIGTVEDLGGDNGKFGDGTHKHVVRLERTDETTGEVRSADFDYYLGSAIQDRQGKPEVVQVVDSVVADHKLVADADYDPHRFAEDMGFRTDEPEDLAQVEHDIEQIRQNASNMRDLLGDETYEKAMYGDED